MGAMAEGEEENWREMEDILEFAIAVLEAAMEVTRARYNKLCMRKGTGMDGGFFLNMLL